MWCTSIRWYAFFVPILIWLSVLPRKSTQWWWWRFCLGLLALAYIGYAAFLLLPAFLWLYWKSDDRPTALKIKSLSVPALLSSLLYAPQLWIFLQVHAKNGGDQISFFPSTLIGFVTGHIANPGIFPLSVIGILSSIGTVITILAITRWRQPPEVKSYLLTSVIILVSGIASKYRNLVILVPLQALAVTRAINLSGGSRWLYVGVALIIAGNLAGTTNVARHEGTAKLGWNLPYSQVLDALDRERARCSSALLVLTYDPVLVWHLHKRGYTLATPLKGSHGTVDSHRGCLALIKTFSGSRGSESIGKMLSDLRIEQFTNHRVLNFGQDPHFSTKRWINADYPEYAAELHFMETRSRWPIPESWRRR
jgi:hypothetical protein